MDKVVAFDSSIGSYRVYFPRCSELLDAVRALPVRRFHKDWDNPYWIAGADEATSIALAQLAFDKSFVVDAAAAEKMAAAIAAEPVMNITCVKTAGIITRFDVRTSYNPEVVALLRSCIGAKMDASKTWSLPAHDTSINVVVELVSRFGLTVSVDTLAATQTLIKTVAAENYVGRCELIDTVISQCEARASAAIKVLPPLAVLPTSFIAAWASDSVSRRKKAKDQALAQRTGERALQRAEERGFEEEAAAITSIQIQAVHLNLRALAGVCDGASSVDDVGFNGPDSKVGRGLALLPKLEPLQAALARSMLAKYTRQLGKAAIEAMY